MSTEEAIPPRAEKKPPVPRKERVPQKEQVYYLLIIKSEKKNLINHTCTLNLKLDFFINNKNNKVPPKPKVPRKPKEEQKPKRPQEPKREPAPLEADGQKKAKTVCLNIKLK